MYIGFVYCQQSWSNKTKQKTKQNKTNKQIYKNGAFAVIINFLLALCYALS